MKANYIVECSVDGNLDPYSRKMDAQKDYEASVEQVKQKGHGYVWWVTGDGEEVKFFSLNCR
jgi:hypothetical protein